jgi:Cu-Zn family superoxide dismutase
MKSTIIILALVLLVSLIVKNTFTVKSEPGYNKYIIANNKFQQNSRAICVINPLGNSNVKGLVTFEKVDSGVRIEAKIEGLTPGKHGFHIHECGDCSSQDGSSAGGHFNPQNLIHGSPSDSKRHTGDLGNIEADASGKAYYVYTDKLINLTGYNSIIGRSIIIHKNADDYKTQPTGNAGGREACGVIGIVCK